MTIEDPNPITLNITGTGNGLISYFMNNNYKHLQVLLLIFITSTGFAQFEFKGEANLKGLVTANERSPFWMHSNQRGRVTDSTNFVTWISGKGIYELNDDASFEIGGGLLYQDANNKAKINIDELYGQYKNSWLQIIGGRKQHEELYDGLSATNGNMLWSLNARPLPGIQIGTVEPIYFLFDKSLGLSGSWNEFHMYKNRYVKNTLLHNKNLYLNYRNDNGLKIKLGIQHFVQWGGTSPETNIGKQPTGVSDYIRIITGHDGGENSSVIDQDNALGNHLGSYDLIISKELKGVDLEFVYNHPFDDGSGMLMVNLFDGYYGLYLDFKKKSRWDQGKMLVKSLMYEFYYTHGNYKSNKEWVLTWDNYFNNSVYRSGWTYNNDIIGLPFFSINQNELDENKYKIDNNSVVVHHIGLQGWISDNMPYKMLFSYRKNYGTSPKNKNSKNIMSTLFDITLLKHPFNLSVHTAADFFEGEVNLGAGIKLSKQF